jgi:transposase
MTTLVSTATCSSFTGIEINTATKLTTSEVTQRVKWALDLQDEMGVTLLQERWDEAHLTELEQGKDAQGRKLPSQGYMALRRLGWHASAMKGVKVNDRFLRVVEENVARSLRLGLYRKAIVEGVLKTWPAQAPKRSSLEWDRLWEVLPALTPKVEVRNRTRQILAFLKENSHLPLTFTATEPAPRLGSVLLLAAADKQMVSLTRQGQVAWLLVLLPKCEKPKTYAQWGRVKLKINLPSTVSDQAVLHTPSLRLKKGTVRVDLPFEVAVTPVDLKGHRVAIGLDWGVNTLLVGSVGKLVNGKVVTDGRPLRFEATSVGLKLTRLRIQREHLAAKITQIQKLLDGLPVSGLLRTELTSKLAQKETQKEKVCSRSRNLGRALGWQAGRWAIDQALSHRATVIYVEDLSTLEAKGMSKKQNARLSGAVKSEVFAAFQHLATKVGIAVVTVPARGTSKGCPRCTRPLKHVASSNRLTSPGRGRWAWCPHCHLSLDRDHAGSQRIVGRGLASQGHTYRDKTGKTAIRSFTDIPVSRCLRRQEKHSFAPVRSLVRKISPRPLRPGNPTLVASVTSQRPVGQIPEVFGTSTDQVLNAFGYRVVHRVQWARLGFGFHRSVQSSPISPHGDWGPKNWVATPECRVA